MRRHPPVRQPFLIVTFARQEPGTRIEYIVDREISDIGAGVVGVQSHDDAVHGIGRYRAATAWIGVVVSTERAGIWIEIYLDAGPCSRCEHKTRESKDEGVSWRHAALPGQDETFRPVRSMAKPYAEKLTGIEKIVVVDNSAARASRPAREPERVIAPGSSGRASPRQS
jgi:hypothetical protein